METKTFYKNIIIFITTNSMSDKEYKETISEKKRYICDACLNMSKEELVAVLNFLVREHVDKERFSQNLDGLKLNLNKVDNHIIDRLYNYIQYNVQST